MDKEGTWGRITKIGVGLGGVRGREIDMHGWMEDGSMDGCMPCLAVGWDSRHFSFRRLLCFALLCFVALFRFRIEFFDLLV
jgi:hypothetical protein